MLAFSNPRCPDVRSAGASVHATAPGPQGCPTAPHLSHTDHRRLRACLEALPSGHPMFLSLHTKLRDARLLPVGELGNDVARIGSRVVYRLRGARVAHRRTLVLPETAKPKGYWLSVLTPVGLALLGGRAGWEIVCPSSSGLPITILLKRVERHPPGEAG